MKAGTFNGLPTLPHALRNTRTLAAAHLIQRLSMGAK